MCWLCSKLTIPLEVGSNLLSSAGHVAIHGASLLSLVADYLVELAKTILDCGKNMSLELSKVVLNRDDVLAVVVLFDDLLVQAVVDAALKDVGVLMSVHLTAGALEGCCVLT